MRRNAHLHWPKTGHSRPTFYSDRFQLNCFQPHTGMTDCRQLKGAGSRNVNKLFRNDDFAVFLIGHIIVIFHYFSQNESVISKMDSCSS